MGFVKEFKEFAIKGNLIDIAVGFVMGAAFTKVTGAFIDGMVMPIIGMVKGKDFSDWQYVLKPAEIAADGTEAVAAVSIKY
ncbi:MAG: MscL family protein, partial [Pelobium sp.]